MAWLSIDTMRSYLTRSIASLNENKLRGLLAEIDFRRRLGELGFADRVSVGSLRLISLLISHHWFRWPVVRARAAVEVLCMYSDGGISGTQHSKPRCAVTYG
jgi:hypothetical protein